MGRYCIISLGTLCEKKTVNSMSSPEDISAIEESINYNAVISATGGLRMRSEANSNAEIIQSIPYYSKIFVTNFDGPADTIDEQPGNWYYANFNNSEGWVWGNYVSKN